MDHSLTLTSDPTWPWTLPLVGLPALVLVAFLLTVLTIWSYLGVPNATAGRVLTILLFRLAALLLAFLALLRPAVGFRDELRVPSLLLLAVDGSQSMTIQDEADNQSRWNSELKVLRNCEPVLQQLREQNNVSVVLYRFGNEVREFDPNGQADAPRTDFGQLLQELLDKHRQERYLRGLIVLSDGADNGTRFAPLPLAAQWRSLPCPLHAVGFGKPTTSEKQNDIAVTDIICEPSPVPVKGELTIKAIIDAPGFENAKVRIEVLFDDKPELTQEATLEKTTGNEVKLKATAPSTPGEIKVTLRVKPLPGEMSVANNEITTYLTVTKEGISVLLVDKVRAWEPQALCDVLRNDPRIRLYTFWVGGDKLPAAEKSDLFEFEKQHYDVIIVGDVRADRMRLGNPNALGIIEKLVLEKGTGLMLLGGFESFGPSWRGTEIERLLPVQLDGVEVKGEYKMQPTEEGLKQFVMRLGDNIDASRDRWNKLREMSGRTQLGPAKQGAIVMARAGNGKDGPTLLVGLDLTKGRVLAFGGDTTFHWRNNPEGVQAHDRFWKQAVLWLAHQEETEGSVWVKPDKRRMPAGSQLGFTMGIRGKGGVDLKEGTFTAKVVSPQQAETPILPKREKDEERGVFWKTDVAGEYRVVVTGKGKDTDGADISGEASARFMVYQDEAEMVRRAADHEFLKKLAATGGGQFLRPDELKGFLEKLKNEPLAQGKAKIATWPDWRSNHLSPFLVLFLLLFVALLTGEWLLRRRWGLV